MKKLLAIVLPVIFLFSACSTSKKMDSQDGILTGSWELTYISGPKIAFTGLFPGKKPTISFDTSNKRFSGNGGCNSYSGTLIASAGHVDFSGSLLSTKMFCAEGAQGEGLFFETLKKINTYSISRDTLSFLSGDVSLMTFTKK